MTDRPTDAEPPLARRAAPASGHELLRLAVASGLLAEDRAREFLARHPIVQVADDPAVVTTLLIQGGFLPRLVTELLLMGYPEGLTIERYRLAELLGKGGMARVFRAEDTLLRRPVAVKVMQSWYDRADVRERFGREVLAAAAVTHPNVVRTYDGGEHAGVPFLVMELLTGRTLYSLRTRGTLSVAQLADYAAQAARALAAVHAAGLVHRDVKPGNLMLCDDGTVKLLDLGLARFVPTGEPDDKRHAPLTRRLPAASFVGTPEYLAPEQRLDSAAADHRADIFGLGATLYHLVAGRPPRPDPLFGDPPPADLLALRPDLPPDLVRLVNRMMASDPDARPQSAGEVADAITALRRETDTRPTRREPTPVVPVAQTRRAPPAPPPRRRRAVLAAGAGGALLVLALLAVRFWPETPPAAVPDAPPAPRWAVEDAGELVRFDAPVRGVAVSPDGRFVAVTVTGGRTVVRDAADGSLTWLPGSGSVGYGLGFTADGATLAFGAGLRSVGLWDVPARQMRVEYPALDTVGCFALRPDGQYLAVGVTGGVGRVRGLGAKGEEFQVFTPHRTAVNAVAFRPGVDEVLFGSQMAGTVTRWAWRTAHLSAGVIGPGQLMPGQLAVLPGGSAFAALTSERVVVYDSDAITFRRQIPDGGRAKDARCLAAGPSGRWVVTGGADGWVRVWDVETSAELAAAPVAAGAVSALAVAADGRTAVAGCADGSVRRVRFTPAG